MDIGMKITPDGGDIIIKNNELQLDGGLETAVTISLFCEKSWWGNEIEDLGINSELVEKLRNGASQQEVVNLCNRLLKWMLVENLVDKIQVDIVKRKIAYKISVILIVKGQSIKMKYSLNTQLQQISPLHERVYEL